VAGPALTQIATQVCTDLDQGGGATAVETAGQDAYNTLSAISSSVTTDDAFLFVTASESAFCPQNAQEVNDWYSAGSPGYDGI
jgi:hypothetical protein